MNVGRLKTLGFRSYVLNGDIEKSQILHQNALAQAPGRLRALASDIRAKEVFETSMLFCDPKNNPNGLTPKYARMVAGNIENIPRDETDQISQALEEVSEGIQEDIDQGVANELNFYDLGNRSGSILELSGSVAVDFPTGVIQVRAKVKST